MNCQACVEYDIFKERLTKQNATNKRQVQSGLYITHHMKNSCRNWGFCVKKQTENPPQNYFIGRIPVSCLYLKCDHVGYKTDLFWVTSEEDLGLNR